MAFFLVPNHPEGRRTYPHHSDDIRLIKNIGAKFIGRAIYRWGGESRLNDPDFWSDAKSLMENLHAFDPEIIFQGCLFEIVTEDVNEVRNGFECGINLANINEYEEGDIIEVFEMRQVN